MVSLNTPMEESSKVNIDYLVKPPEPPTPNTTTTTPKPVHPDQFLGVYVLIVNEQEFIDKGRKEDFKKVVWEIFTK